MQRRALPSSLYSLNRDSNGVKGISPTAVFNTRVNDATVHRASVCASLKAKQAIVLLVLSFFGLALLSSASRTPYMGKELVARYKGGNAAAR